MKANNGLITQADLQAYRAAERVPVRGNYRGFEVVSMPPPSSGGVHIVQMLNMLEHFRCVNKAITALPHSTR
jgi:gamma-glutamyltranspeptidase/glutathione hydrolase